MHGLLIGAIGLLVVASVLLAGLSWRLAQGSIDVGWLAGPVREALMDDAGPVRVSFDRLSLAWEGFHKGVDYPLDLRVSNISVTNATGRPLVAAPDAHLTFSFAGLMLGRLVPRAIEVDHARVAVTREADGSINLGVAAETGDTPSGDAFDPGLLQEQLSHPVGTDHGRSRGLLDQIRRAHFRDTEAFLRDRQSGLVLRGKGMDLDLIRGESGIVRGTLLAPLAVGDQQAVLKAGIVARPGAGGSVEADLTAFRPAAIGGLPPALAFAAALDAPITMSGTVTFDAAYKLKQIAAEARLGEGQIHVAGGDIPLRSGQVSLAGAPNALNLTQARFDLAHAPGGTPQIIDISGSLSHSANRFAAAATIGLDAIDIADLPKYWPPGAARGARHWVTEHVTAGTATHGTISLAAESDDTLHDVVLTKASGDLDVSGGTFTWIDNLTPVEQTDAHLRLVDPDTLDIAVSSARHRIRGGAPDLLIRNGRLRITGLSHHDQTAVIRTEVAGPISSALILLKEPRLHLLSVHPIALKTAGGEATAVLDFQLPLETKLSIDDVQLHVDAHLKDVRLLDIAGGHELDGGVFDLSIDKEGLTLKGNGSLASILVTLDGAMDFTSGAVDQITQKITVTGQPLANQLDAAGLHVTDFVTGPMAVSAVMIERRNGEGSIAIGGDLTQSTLMVRPLAWTKDAGEAANISATLLMSHERLKKIDRIALRGNALLLNGAANFGTDGKIRSVQLDNIQLGRTQGHGTILVGPSSAIDIVLQGGQIDLAPKLTEKPTDQDPSLPPVVTPRWTLDARFDRALLAHEEVATGFLAKVTGAGDTALSLDAVGATTGGGVFKIRIDPAAGKAEPGVSKRHLLVEAKDAGRFLRGMDAVSSLQSGHLTLDATFETPFGYHPLSGTAIIDDVVVRNSPVLGKLLQAITLYGLVDALSGPGMGFSHIVVPFRYEGSSLDIQEAHAANPSLGVTAKGRIGLRPDQIAVSGTIVPAYFFNSMLGQLPLVGKLFSPEPGGGLFAARFSLSGPIGDPTVSINPISALTPGFLRDIFGIFDNSGTAPPRPH